MKVACFILLIFLSTINSFSIDILSADKISLNDISYNNLSPKIISKSDWFPRCCGEYKTNKQCEKKAILFTQGTKNSFHQSVKKVVFPKGKLSISKFYNVFCTDNWNGSAYEYDSQGVYENGFLTIHDTQLYSSSRGNRNLYNKFVRKMEAQFKVLYFSDELSKDPLFVRDQMQALYVNFLHKMHRAWADFGYHFLIGENTGKIFQGRSIKYMGAHAGRPRIHKGTKIDPDFGNIGIVVVGNKILFPHSFNRLQKDSAVKIMKKIKTELGSDINKRVFHGYISSTSCGTRTIAPWLHYLNPKISTVSYGDANPTEKYRRDQMIYDHYKSKTRFETLKSIEEKMELEI